MNVYSDMNNDPQVYNEFWKILTLWLGKDEIERIRIESNTPYHDDLDLLLDYQLLIGLAEIVNNKTDDLGTDFFKDETLNETNFDKLHKSIQAVTILEEKIRLRIKTRQQATEETANLQPRVLRLANRMALTAKEQTALIFMIITQAGMLNKPNNDFTLNTIMSRCPMSAREIFRFIGKDRRHIQDGLVEIVGDKYNRGGILHMEFRTQDKLVKAVIGEPLTMEEFLKVDNTALGEVLAEEPEGQEFINFVQKSVQTSEEVNFFSAESDKKEDEDFNLHEFLTEEKGLEAACTHSALLGNGDLDSPKELQPYTTDLEYLEDHFRLLSIKVQGDKKLFEDSSTVLAHEKPQAEILRELSVLERIQQNKIDRRLELTNSAGKWMPRLERFAEKRKLHEFEKFAILLLIGLDLDDEMRKQWGHSITLGSIDTNRILRVYRAGLSDRLKLRTFFHKSATLVRESIITVYSGIAGYTSDSSAQIDRKMLDYITGVDTDFGDIVDGGHLYFPTVKLDRVVLPDEQKQHILSTVENFGVYQKNRKALGFDEIIPYGNAIVMLFHGPSGVGKTMMANGIANHLGKKILLINFPSLGMFNGDEVIDFIFSAARINDAIIFFDECEAIFASRENGNAGIGLLLTAIERHDGLVVMATNRAFALDEAMHRRITMAIEFKKPDPSSREKIWREHIPEQLSLSDDVDFKRLAVKYELAGGYIKNAILSALSVASCRGQEHPVICMEDLEKGATLQMRGHLHMANFDRRVVPRGGFETLVLPSKLTKSLNEIIQCEKAGNILIPQWGFDKIGYGTGTGVLFYGSPGTGKSLAAEAIGFELGKPLLVVNVAELESKYVGETAKNIDDVFKEARVNNCVLVFDEADAFFGSRHDGGGATERYANQNVNILLHHVERFPGTVILTTNLKGHIDEAFFRRFKFILEFKKPDKDTRVNIWQKLIPHKTPLGADINFKELADRFEFTGGNIKNCVFRAASKAALRQEGDRYLSMTDLLAAANEEYISDNGQRIGF